MEARWLVDFGVSALSGWAPFPPFPVLVGGLIRQGRRQAPVAPGPPWQRVGWFAPLAA
jgi:hypothetical protein